jgi:hypothetical protein
VPGWTFTQIGAFLALSVIASGGVQSLSPTLLAKGKARGPAMAMILGIGLPCFTALIRGGCSSARRADHAPAG